MKVIKSSASFLGRPVAIASSIALLIPSCIVADMKIWLC